LTWRLGFGVVNKGVPEEWEDHKATDRLPLTLDMYVLLSSPSFAIVVPYLTVSFIVSIAQMLSGRIWQTSGGLICNRIGACIGAGILRGAAYGAALQSLKTSLLTKCHPFAALAPDRIRGIPTY
jgi:hypothetical protein